MPNRSWIEIAVSHAGMRTAMRAIEWAYAWAVVREVVGHDPSVDEVAEWWNQPRRSAFRDQAAFREAFPMLDTPAPIYDAPDARARIGRHASRASRFDKWVQERVARREEDSVAAVVLPASQP
jgi:hypothetical protein